MLKNQTQPNQARNTNVRQLAMHFSKIAQALCLRRKIGGRIVFAHRGARYVTLGMRLANSLQLDNALKLGESLALASHVPHVLCHRVDGHVAFQFQLPEQYWISYTRELGQGLTLGYGDMAKPVMHNLTPPHTLVGGTSGSGKTETLKALTAGLMESYSPKDLALVMIDPHSDFTDFDNNEWLVGPIARTPEDIELALTWVARQLIQRRENNIRDGKRIVVVMDEADSDIVLKQPNNLDITSSLAKESRKFVFNLILGVQKASHKKMPDILDNLARRYIGRVSDAGISARLTGWAGLDCHKLTGNGDFMHVSGADAERFQVAQLAPGFIDSLTRIQPPAWTGTDVGEVMNQLDNFEKDEEIIMTGPATHGRPANELSMKLLVRYVQFGPDYFSPATAREVLSPLLGRPVSKDMHLMHKRAAIEYLKEQDKLLRLLDEES